jgi:hypothetical protein
MHLNRRRWMRIPTKASTEDKPPVVITIAVRSIGAVIGAAFGLVTCYALLPVLCGGNMLAAGFLFLPGAPVSLIVGGVAGAISATRVAKRLGDIPATTDKRRSQRIVVLSLLLGIPSAFFAIVWIGRIAMEPPSDAAMLRHFEHNEVTFAALAQMATADKGLDRVDRDWTMPADTSRVGVSTGRLEVYRRLLNQAGTPRGFQIARDHEGFNFFFWLMGSAISDDKDKGFAYRTTPPPNTVQSLDGIRASSREPFIAYRHIHGNWYLFYEFIPD